MKFTSKKRVKRVVSLFLVFVLALTGLFSLTASATVPFLQSGDVIAYGTFSSGVFNSGVDNRLTVNARAQVKAGSPSSVNLSLQKYTTYGWSTVANYSLLCDNNTYTVWRDLVISTNTDYRILCSITSGGADVATVYLAIGPWESVA